MFKKQKEKFKFDKYKDLYSTFAKVHVNLGLISILKLIFKNLPHCKRFGWIKYTHWPEFAIYFKVLPLF